jgi:TetR/AcrR family transcriptional regulator, copper-responsive repressor
MPDAKPRRGRPPAFDRTDALTAAMNLFWRHGFEGTSIAMLTKAMGVNPPTLYAAFGSKAELYRHTLTHYLTVERREHGQLVQDAPTARQAVEAYLRFAARAYADPTGPPGCMVGAAALQCGEDAEEARDTVLGLRAMAYRAILRRIEQGKTAGELPVATDASALAHFYGAVIQGMSAQACDGADETVMNQIVEVALSAWPREATARR